MIKKSIALLLSLLLLVVAMPAMAEESAHSFLANGDFESWGADGVPTSWGLKGGEAGKALVRVEGRDVKNGEGTIALVTEETGVYLSQGIGEVAGGTPYVFSAWMMGEGATITVDFTDETGAAAGKRVMQSFEKSKNWKEITHTFTAPEGTVRMSFLLRNTAQGTTVMYDDVKLTGKRLTALERIKFADEDNKEHIINGDFENWANAAQPNLWGVKNGTFGKNVTAVSEGDIPSGKSAVKLSATGSAFYMSSSPRLTKLVGGETYLFSAYIKGAASGGITLEYSDADGASQGRFLTSFPTSEKWEQVSVAIQVPEKATNASFLLRNFSTEGDVYWDKVSLLGKGGYDLDDPVLTGVSEKEEEETVKYEYVVMPEFAEESITNGDFEAGSASWMPYGNTPFGENEYVAISEEKAYSGTKSLKIFNNVGNNPWACQRIDGKYFDMGAVYQLSAMVYTEEAVDAVLFKLEWYDEDGAVNTSLGGSVLTTPFVSKDENGWARCVGWFTMPCDCAYFKLYARQYNPTGTFYYDDISFYKIEREPIYPIAIETDKVFYYTGTERGTASIALNSEDFPGILDGTVNVSLTGEDGDVIFTQSGILAEDGNLSVTYPVYAMQEKKEYTLSVTATDAGGNIIGTESTKIMKYKRPALMEEDGTIVVDGAPFNPVFMYHVRKNEIQYMPEIGVNVVQSADQSVDFLNVAHQYGIKVLVRMYPNMKPAAHPDNLEHTIEVVKKIKDHPALLGYMVMDEPTLYFPNHWHYFYDSYKVLRDLDPNHLIYMVQDTAANYEKVGKYVDILALDPYPKSADRLAFAGDRTKEAAEAVDYGRSVWTLNQTFLYGGYFPTIMEVRNMWYQALMNGANAPGHYCFYGAYTENNSSKSLAELDIWPELKAFGEDEAREALAYFVSEKYPVFNNYRSDGVSWSSYVKDGKVRMIVLNRENKEKTVSIPLKSDGGTAVIEGFNGTLIYGGSGDVSGNGILELTIEPNGIYVYEITPQNVVDFSKLNPIMESRDLGAHPWAAEAVRELEKLGIANVDGAAYRPGEAITRGEFAHFLINSLGLTSESVAEAFADVDTNLFYGDAILQGKALGILKGVGNNAYNPDAPISRQDLMVICARGIRQAKQLEEANVASLALFADGGNVADYAQADVAAMVQKGIIRGNADGTLNPLGNTTRAEAAVIMQRIMDL